MQGVAARSYFAYESELSAQITCVMHGRRASHAAADKHGQLRPLAAVATEEVLKMRKDAKEEGWDVATRMATLKQITKGSKTPFMFIEDEAEQPRRRPHRGSRSARSC